MTQTDRFTRMPPYQRHSDTSKAAAVAIKPKAASKRAIVLRFLQERGSYGATNNEIEAALGMRLSTVCARCNELQGAGRVKDSGKRRKTETGREAVVWIAEDENDG